MKFRFKSFKRLCGSIWQNEIGDTRLTFEKFKQDTCAWTFASNQTDLWAQVPISSLETQRWYHIPDDTRNRDTDHTLTFIKFRGRSSIQPVTIEYVQESYLLKSAWKREESPQNLSFKTIENEIRAVLYADEDNEAKLSFTLQCLTGTKWNMTRKRKDISANQK